MSKDYYSFKYHLVIALAIITQHLVILLLNLVWCYSDYWSKAIVLIQHYSNLGL